MLKNACKVNISARDPYPATLSFDAVIEITMNDATKARIFVNITHVPR